MTSERTSDSFFNCTNAERAVFEAGIKLGGIFHQFTGTPVSMNNAESIETAIRDAVRAQPFVRAILVVIDREMLQDRCSSESGEIGDGYTTLTGEMLDVKLSVAYRGKMAVCGMKYVEDLEYPLMFVGRVEDICDDDGSDPFRKTGILRRR